MTLTWWPPTASARRGLRLLVSGEQPDVAQQLAHEEEGLSREQQVSVLEFLRESDYFMDLLGGMLAACRPLTIDETTTYLHNCVSDRWYPLGPMAFYQDLDAQLCDTPLTGGWYPQLGDWHLRTCSIRGYPAKSVVGIVRHLDAANLDYRWCTRWVGLEKQVQAGLLRKTQGAWIGQEKSLMGRMAESMSNQPPRILNTDATNKAEEVDAARQEDRGGYCGVWRIYQHRHGLGRRPRPGRNEAALTSCRRLPTRALRPRQSASMRPLPGSPRNPATASITCIARHQHSLFLAHVSPGVTAAWPGPEHDAHFQAGPWFYVHTEHNTLFRVVNHVRDLGHFLILGATGAGKSTFGNFLRAQWMQYPHAQAKVFDLDGHARLLTYLLGGSWHDLGSPTLRFQPLRYVDDPLRRGIALQWLLDLVAEFGVPLTAGTHAFLSAGLTRLARLPAARAHAQSPARGHGRSYAPCGDERQQWAH